MNPDKIIKNITGKNIKKDIISKNYQPGQLQSSLGGYQPGQLTQQYVMTDGLGQPMTPATPDHQKPTTVTMTDDLGQPMTPATPDHQKPTPRRTTRTTTVTMTDGLGQPMTPATPDHQKPTPRTIDRREEQPSEFTSSVFGTTPFQKTIDAVEEQRRRDRWQERPVVGLEERSVVEEFEPGRRVREELEERPSKLPFKILQEDKPFQRTFDKVREQRELEEDVKKDEIPILDLKPTLDLKEDRVPGVETKVDERDFSEFFTDRGKRQITETKAKIDLGMADMGLKFLEGVAQYRADHPKMFLDFVQKKRDEKLAEKHLDTIAESAEILSDKKIREIEKEIKTIQPYVDEYEEGIKKIESELTPEIEKTQAEIRQIMDKKLGGVVEEKSDLDGTLLSITQLDRDIEGAINILEEHENLDFSQQENVDWYNQWITHAKKLVSQREEIQEELVPLIRREEDLINKHSLKTEELEELREQKILPVHSGVEALGDKHDELLKKLYGGFERGEKILDLIPQRDILETKELERQDTMDYLRSQHKWGDDIGKRLGLEALNVGRVMSINLAKVPRALGTAFYTAPQKIREKELEGKKGLERFLTSTKHTVTSPVYVARGIYDWKDDSPIVNVEALKGGITGALMAFTAIKSGGASTVALPSIKKGTKAAIGTGLKKYGFPALIGASVTIPPILEKRQYDRDVRRIEGELEELEQQKTLGQIKESTYDITRDYLEGSLERGKQRQMTTTDIVESGFGSAVEVAGILGTTTAVSAAVRPAKASPWITQTQKPGTLQRMMGGRSFRPPKKTDISQKLLTGRKVSQIKTPGRFQIRPKEFDLTYEFKKGTHVKHRGGDPIQESLPGLGKHTWKGVLRTKKGPVQTKIEMKPEIDTTTKQKVGDVVRMTKVDKKGIRYITEHRVGDVEATTKIFDKKGKLLKTISDKPIDLQGYTGVDYQTLMRETYRTTPIQSDRLIQQQIATRADVLGKGKIGGYDIKVIGRGETFADKISRAVPGKITTRHPYDIIIDRQIPKVTADLLRKKGTTITKFPKLRVGTKEMARDTTGLSVRYKFEDPKVIKDAYPLGSEWRGEVFRTGIYKSPPAETTRIFDTGKAYIRLQPTKGIQTDYTKNFIQTIRTGAQRLQTSSKNFLDNVKIIKPLKTMGKKAHARGVIFSEQRTILQQPQTVLKYPSTVIQQPKPALQQLQKTLQQPQTVLKHPPKTVLQQQIGKLTPSEARFKTSIPMLTIKKTTPSLMNIAALSLGTKTITDRLTGTVSLLETRISPLTQILPKTDYATKLSTQLIPKLALKTSLIQQTQPLTDLKPLATTMSMQIPGFIPRTKIPTIIPFDIGLPKLGIGGMPGKPRKPRRGAKGWTVANPIADYAGEWGKRQEKRRQLIKEQGVGVLTNKDIIKKVL